MPGTNTLAYYKKFVTYGRKMFYRVDPWLYSLILEYWRKLARMVLTGASLWYRDLTLPANIRLG